MRKRLWLSKFLSFALLALPASLFAQTPDPRGGPMGIVMSLFPILAFIAIFYFLLFRPQQQAQKQKRDMLSAIKRSDKVLTSGGLYGTVVNVRGDVLDVKLADNLKVELNRNYVAKVIAAQNGSAEPAQTKKG